MQLPRQRILIITLCALAATALLLMLWIRFQSAGINGPATGGAPDIGGPFSLTDQHGQRITEAALNGHLTLIYFGYTSCPDVCPMELQNIGAAFDRLKREDANKLLQLQAFFITIDPERDTVAALADYMSNFHPRILGLTGSPAEIAAAAKAFRVYYSRDPQQQDTQAYLVDHTGIVYLMGPDGKFLAHFSPNTPPDQIAGKLREYFKFL